MKDVSIIIVTYNSKRVIEACLASIIRETTRYSFEIIVSDNGSSDGTIELVKNFKDVALILNNKNLGFAKANNIGLKQAGGAYVLFLNPDTEVVSGAIDILIDHLNNEPNIKMATGALVYPDGRRQPNIKQNPTLGSQLMIALKLARIWPRAKTIQTYLARDFNYQEPSLVEQIMGACMMVRSEDIKKINGFDEDYFIWFEDIELCLVYQKRGWPIKYYPNTKFVHHESEAFRRTSPLLNQWRFLSSLRLFARKHWFPFGYILIVLCKPIAIILTVLGLIIGARPKTQSELR